MQESKGERTSEIAAAVQAGKADILSLWAAVERFAWQQALRWARAMEGRAGVEESDLLQVAFIDPQGYNYARYSAFVPNARSLLTPDMAIDRSYLSLAEPWRDESRDEMLRMTLRVDGKPNYTLVLPADEEYLDAVKAYLDIDVFADAMLCDIRFKVPYIGELIRDTDCPAVEDYNDFAEALEDIWQQDGMLLTYAAVLEAEQPDTLRGACELLRNLDNYQRITEGAYGYGQQRLQETLGLDDEAIYELDGYMDFEKYGQDCMENDCVTKTEFGLLRRLEPPFPEQRQGQRMM